MCGWPVSRILSTALRRLDDHSSKAAVADDPLAANPGLSGQASLPGYPSLDHTGARPLFGIAPGGACRAASVAGRAVGSYPTVSPFPCTQGSLFSVALSLGLPPPGVTRHRCRHGVRTFLERCRPRPSSHPHGPSPKRWRAKRQRESVPPDRRSAPCPPDTRAPSRGAGTACGRQRAAPRRPRRRYSRRSASAG
ncbi:hypothetical protein SAMN05444339_10677 [Loktanella atrilutea]|uniref:Uncharacterized protein n=1 Tax=Loktanella atrilutea TaxID=366533 RepID=A0A1M5BM71_LOKAT|nr:hypothetical protein SAMN05444339_10677 [Loktanella atrilutea]